MSNRDITDKRGLLEFLKARDDFLTIDKEVDPIYEVSGLIKALEGGPTIYCTNIKGFPGHRVLTNTFATRDRIAAMFGAEDATKVKHKCLDAIQNQIPYEIVDNGPCQENVITENVDVKATIPIIKHTEQDAGRLLGAITFVSEGIKGTHVSYNRSNFRGKDYSSLSLNLGTHFEHHLLKVRQTKGKLPITINISPPPAVEAMAAGGFTLAGAVYIFNLRKYHAVVRPAVLTAFLGYTLVILALLVDLGQPWYIWHIIINWNIHSPLFEVGMCVMSYTVVLALEFSPAVFEGLNKSNLPIIRRINWHIPWRVIRAIQIPLVIAKACQHDLTIILQG